MQLLKRCLLGLVLLPVALAGAEESARVDYATHIKPLLVKHCIRCHGSEKQQSGLRVDSGRALMAGGDSGPAVITKEPAKSLLIQAVNGTDGASKMPPEGLGLTADEKRMLHDWIASGAPFPADEVTVAAARKGADHWSFQPVQHPVPPAIAGHAARGPIDCFIIARLEPLKLTPSAEAERATLIRRASLDLCGVPPSPEELHEFVQDSTPDAFERVVDRLLASPHFGERWGRDWLDVARYADSNGFTRDMPRTIWKFRDWVVAALNRNLPFDQFVIDQLAGDMLPDADLDQRVATGFHRNTLVNEEGGTDPEQFRVESVVDRVNTTGTVFLGLTVGCAQCHDHKYDPISQREYYQLYAYFNSTVFAGGDPTAPRIDVPSPEQLAAGEPERQKQIRSQIAELDKEINSQADAIAADMADWEKTLTDDDKKKLPFNVKNAVDLPPRDRSATHKRDLDAYFRGLDVARQKYPQLDAIAKLRSEEPKFPTTMVMQELAQPRETHIHMRGDFLRKGARVIPAVPAVLGRSEASTDGADAPIETRLDLARWLVSADNPLTARVTVNRVWQKLFGRGLVETENDFGTQGTPPSHPQLLDWLASDFSGLAQSQERPGWDFKRLHRQLVTSATYRQSSRQREDVAEADPTNKWLAQQNRLRLDAEVIRDTALAASGLLTTELGGPPVYPPQPDGVFDFTQDKKPWKTETDRSRYRKAMYTHLWRSSLYPAMTVFDFPDANVACTRRIRSNTPLQSLTLANDLTFVEFARGLALRVLTSPPGDDSHRLILACELCLSRDPGSTELSRLRDYVQQQRARFTSDEKSAAEFAPQSLPSQISTVEAATWTAVARVLMNLDEFITRE
ncbi:MAG: PSD1 domain-containing protein [Planctomycetes bacterium]|nr:PSD1 domain-containing protein [Planctomycetota bacterium]